MQTTPTHRIPAAMTRAMKTTAANASSVKHVHARTVDFVQRFHKLHNHSTPRETVSILTFEYYLSSINDNNNNNNNEKAPRETQKHCARAGCSKVQTPPARLLQRHTQTDRQDRLQYTAPLASAQCKRRSERRKHCALAVVRRSQKFSPRRRPPSRGRGTAKV